LLTQRMGFIPRYRGTGSIALNCKRFSIFTA
jgi:hypothetical protein